MVSPLHAPTDTSDIHGIVLANSTDISKGHDAMAHSSASVPFFSTNITKEPAGAPKNNAQISGPDPEDVISDVLKNHRETVHAHGKTRRLLEKVRRKAHRFFQESARAWLLKQVYGAERDLVRANDTNVVLSADASAVDGPLDTAKGRVPRKKSKKQKRRELKQLSRTIMNIDHPMEEDTREERRSCNRKGKGRLNREFVVTRPRGRQYLDWAKRALSRKIDNLSRGTLAHSQPVSLSFPAITDVSSEGIRIPGKGYALDHEISTEAFVTPNSAGIYPLPVPSSGSIPVDPALYDLVSDIDLAPPLGPPSFDDSYSFDYSSALQGGPLVATNSPASEPSLSEDVLDMNLSNSHQHEASFTCRVHVLKSRDALRAAINAYNHRSAHPDDLEPFVLWTDASVTKMQMAAAFVYRSSNLNADYQTNIEWGTRGFAIRSYEICSVLAEMIGIEEALRFAFQQLPHATMGLNDTDDSGCGDHYTDRQIVEELESFDGAGWQKVNYRCGSAAFEPSYDTSDHATCIHTHLSCIEQFPLPQPDSQIDDHETDVVSNLQRCTSTHDCRVTTDSQGERPGCRGLSDFDTFPTPGQLPPLYNEQALDDFDTTSEKVYEVPVQGSRAAGSGLIPASETPFKSVHIYTDCQSVLEALLAGGAHARSRHESIMRINALIFRLGMQGIQVEMHWVPGHSGVEGNDKADQVAKEVRRSLEESRPIVLPAVNISPGDNCSMS